MGVLPEVDMAAARAAVAANGARAAALVRSIEHPTAPALGKWDVSEVAVHLSHAVDAVTAMAQGAGPLIGEIGELGGFTRMFVQAEGERDFQALAGRMEASLARFLDLTAKDEAATRTWFAEGTSMPMSSLVCHVLNELLVHGWDIATAEGKPWPIERAHAGLVVSGFLFPAFANLGRSMVDQKAAAGLHATYDIRVRGGGRAVLSFDDGDLSVDAAPSGPVDCHLSVDPVGFLLVGWGRESQWGQIARGKLLAWGRKPWLGFRLRALLTNP
ncbi:MAG TPA: maleylpyruvate isomerase N-terminal domain-containing protein [Acidimicrobiales bacterium]|nr:maleylpyruvate isomerase N-terminal domain-containing protein [Acidimicrobiales bacterium]